MDQSLRGAFDLLERAGQALRVTAEVDWRHEAAGVLWELSHGPAVLFEHVTDHEVPLVGNLLNTRDKLSTALGIEANELGPRMAAAVDRRTPVEVVDDAPCQEVVVTDGIDLTAMFPVPQISEHDGGRYISAGIVVAADPVSGRQNLAIARLQVQGPDRLGVNFAPTHTWGFLQERADRGETMPIAIAIGCHPVVMAASQYLVPFDEAEVAGALFGEPLQVARCRTVDLTVPAQAEIVLEGVIEPSEGHVEGPFGEFAGLYSGTRVNPVIRITAVTTRVAPWFQMIVGGRHPEHLVTGAVAREATLLRSISAVVPGARQVVLTEGGSSRFHAVVSIEQRAQGEARLAILTCFSTQDLIKHVTVVDHDIDPTDPTEVEWAVATRLRADRDVFVVDRMKSNPVDPMCLDGTISKIGFDATLPPGSVGEASYAHVPAEVRARIAERWSELMGPGEPT